jgi:hypothetical protein
MKPKARASRGMAVVTVMILIAVLFLAGTGMALTLSSSLHTVDVLAARNAVHYAAESAVARGVAAASQTPPCSVQGGPINGLFFTAVCQPPLHDLAAKSLKKWSLPGGRLQAGCQSYPLTDPAIESDEFGAAWTVIGWRTPAGSAAVTVWIDDHQLCDAQPSLPSLSPAYVSAKADHVVLHIAVTGSAVEFGGFVVRAAEPGHNTIVTVVGRAGIEVDEADTALPAGGVKFWNTVLP